MSEELINPGSNRGTTEPETPPRPERPNVRILLLGKAEDVDYTIAELHLKQFGEISSWSRPLRFTEMQQFALNPGEVLRIYKRYLTQ
jgi:hypothetical protein